MSERLDILFVADAAIPLKQENTSVCQVGFDFEGLAAAYQLLPDVETAVILPPASGLSSGMPTQASVMSFYGDGLCDPILRAISKYETVHYDSFAAYFRIKERLDSIPETCRADFSKEAVSGAAQAMFKRLFRTVANGGKAFLLLPDPENHWSEPADTAVIDMLLPGLRIEHDKTWSARINDGKYAWLFEGVRPNLLFPTGTNTGKTSPHLSGEWIPSGCDGSMKVGAADRNGGVRAMLFCLLKGEFIVTSEVTFGALRERLGIDRQTPVPSKVGTDDASLSDKSKAYIPHCLPGRHETHASADKSATVPTLPSPVVRQKRRTSPSQRPRKTAGPKAAAAEVTAKSRTPAVKSGHTVSRTMPKKKSKDHALVKISMNPSGSGRLVDVAGNTYCITRNSCIQVIEALKSGLPIKIKNPKPLFQHDRTVTPVRSKDMRDRITELHNIEKGDHERFADKHLTSNGHGYWRIVASRN